MVRFEICFNPYVKCCTLYPIFPIGLTPDSTIGTGRQTRRQCPIATDWAAPEEQARWYLQKQWKSTQSVIHCQESHSDEANLQAMWRLLGILEYTLILYDLEYMILL